MAYTERDIYELMLGALGGASSPLQDGERANLGNPLTGEIFVNDAEADKPGLVWLHNAGPSYAEIDSDDTERDDAQSQVFTALLPPDKKRTIPKVFGTPVITKRVRGILIVDRADDTDAAQYTAGVDVAEPVQPIGIAQFDWGLLRPTNPPSMGFEVSGAIYSLNGTLYGVPGLGYASVASQLTGLNGGQAVAIQVTLDPTVPELNISAGSAFTDNRDPASGLSDHQAVFSSYPSSEPTDEFVKGWIKLYAGMTAITAADILHAAPDFTKGASGGTLSGLDDTDISSGATGHMLFYNASGDWENRAPQLTDLSDVSSASQSNFLFLGSTGGAYHGRPIVAADLPTVPVSRGGTNQTTYTKGDVLVAQNSSTLGKLGVGTNGQVLTADSVQTLGVRWADPSGSSGGGIDDFVKITGGTRTLDSSTEQLVADFTEDVDTLGAFDSGTDDDYMTIPGGKGGIYLLGWSVRIDATLNAAGFHWQVNIKAGLSTVIATQAYYADFTTNGSITNLVGTGSALVTLSESDIIRMYVQNWGAGFSEPSDHTADMWLIRIADTP